MQCPVCTAEMAAAHTDVSSNSQTGDQYDRTIYSCTKDDSWVTVETPRKA